MPEMMMKGELQRLFRVAGERNSFRSSPGENRGSGGKVHTSEGFHEHRPPDPLATSREVKTIVPSAPEPTLDNWSADRKKATDPYATEEQSPGARSGARDRVAGSARASSRCACLPDRRVHVGGNRRTVARSRPECNSARKFEMIRTSRETIRGSYWEAEHAAIRGNGKRANGRRKCHAEGFA